MAKRAAEFQGICQVCGSRQMLPEGKLAKHGYRVQWSMFVGTCWGSHNLPFEQDKTLVDVSIERAENEAESLRKYVEKLKSFDGTKMWVNVYVRDQKYKGEYKWLQVEVTQKLRVGSGSDYAWADYTFTYEEQGQIKEKEIQYLPTEGTYLRNPNPSAADLANAFQVIGLYTNAQFSKANPESRLRMVEDYIAYQKDRIRNWAPKPLTPRPPAVVPDPNRVPRRRRRFSLRG